MLLARFDQEIYGCQKHWHALPQSFPRIKNHVTQKARYEERDAFLRVSKAGFIGLEFVPVGEITETGIRYRFDERKVFFLSIRDIGAILCISPNGEEGESEKLVFQHTNKPEGEPQKMVYVQRVDKSSIEFTYKEGRGEKITTTLSIKLTPNDLVVMQKMLEFAVPYIHGWHHLGNSQVVEEYQGKIPGPSFF